MEFSYDEKCEELARYFLSDISHVTDEDVKRLSQTIQSAIEDWIDSRRRPA